MKKQDTKKKKKKKRIIIMHPKYGEEHYGSTKP